MIEKMVITTEARRTQRVTFLLTNHEILIG
jgi:hypothetical protein